MKQNETNRNKPTPPETSRNHAKASTFNTKPPKTIHYCLKLAASSQKNIPENTYVNYHLVDPV